MAMTVSERKKYEKLLSQYGQATANRYKQWVKDGRPGGRGSFDPTSGGSSSSKASVSKAPSGGSSSSKASVSKAPSGGSSSSKASVSKASSGGSSSSKASVSKAPSGGSSSSKASGSKASSGGSSSSKASGSKASSGRNSSSKASGSKASSGENSGGRRVSKKNRPLLREFRDYKKIVESLGLEDTQDIDAREWESMLDPNSPNFVGNIGKGTQDQVNALNENIRNRRDAEGNLKFDPQLQSVIDKARESLESAGKRPEDVQQALQALQDNAAYVRENADKVINQLTEEFSTIGQEDQRLTDVLKLMEQGLSGLDAKENQALREQSLRVMEGRKASMQRRLNDTAARNQLRGGASVAAQRQLDRMVTQESLKAEQDVLLKNMEEQRLRRSDYANMLRDLEKNRGDQKINAGATLGTATAALLGQGTTADDTLALRTSEATKAERDARRDALVTAGNITQGAVTQAETQDLGERGLATQTINTAEAQQFSRLFDVIKELQSSKEFNAMSSDQRNSQLVSLMTGLAGVKTARDSQDAVNLQIAKSGSGGSGGPPLDVSGIIDAILNRGGTPTGGGESSEVEK